MNSNHQHLFNNRLLNPQELTISPFSRLLTAGCGFFTTALYRDGRLCFWEDHLKRLNGSLKEFNYILQENLPERQDCEKFLQNQLGSTSARVRLTVFPADNPEKWDWLLTYQTYQPHADSFTLKIVDEYADYPLLKHKSLNYWSNLNHLQANAQNVEIARLNRFGKINEGCRTNILLLKNKTICYTDFTNNYLPGIMQQQILNNHQQLGFAEILAYPQGFTSDELINADLLILTNSLIGTGAVQTLHIRAENYHYQQDQTLIQQLNQSISALATNCRW